MIRVVGYIHLPHLIRVDWTADFTCPGIIPRLKVTVVPPIEHRDPPPSTTHGKDLTAHLHDQNHYTGCGSPHA